MPQSLFSTQAFAKRAHVSLRTLRFYDRSGLLQPSCRARDGQRLYSDVNLIGLHHIRALQFLEFSLAEIATFKHEVPKGSRDSLEHYAFSLKLRRAQLSQLLTALDRVKDILARGEGNWPTVTEPLQALQQEQRRRWLEHIASADPQKQRMARPANRPHPVQPETIESQTIESLLHPLSQTVAQLLTRSGRQALGRILIDDEENIVAALGSGVQLEAVFQAGEPAAVPSWLSPDIPHYRLARRTAKKLFGNERESRIFAVAQAPRPLGLEVFAEMRQDIVVLEDVRLAGNIGAIVRTTRALGYGGLVLLAQNDAETAELYDRRLIRASRGGIFALPVVSATITEFLEFLAAQPLELAVTSPHAQTSVQRLARAPQRLAFAFGHEKEGCSPALGRAARFSVSVPMVQGSESLNVSVAAGIVLYSRAQGRLAARGW